MDEKLGWREDHYLELATFILNKTRFARLDISNSEIGGDKLLASIYS
jgi:hypothetical protein